ncbi:MAG: CmcI family methyltransferase [Gaiellaceae bacterium]
MTAAASWLGALYRRAKGAHPRPDDVVRDFHRLYYDSASRTWSNTRWLGTPAQKCPLDLWVYQEILYELRPAVIVESGTANGGSALFLASVCDLLGHGEVISIDVLEQERPSHDRVTYLSGSSVAPEIRARVTALVGDRRPVLVILDSDHSRDHVLEELRSYAPLVTPGSYAIVEDTNVNGHPVLSEFGAGPMEAVDQFLRESTEFAIDADREKFFLTFNPRGFLRKR